MLLMPVKSCIYDILNPDKVNVIDSIKENFTQLYFKTVTYMCQYLSKPEDQALQAMKKAAKEVFEKNMHHHEFIQKIAKAYLSNQECSVQEEVYHISLELKLRIISPAVYFVNTNNKELNTRKLTLSKKELSELPDDIQNIFKKANTDRYMEKPNATFHNRKHSILSDFYYAEFYILHSRK